MTPLDPGSNSAFLEALRRARELERQLAEARRLAAEAKKRAEVAAKMAREQGASSTPAVVNAQQQVTQTSKALKTAELQATEARSIADRLKNDAFAQLSPSSVDAAPPAEAQLSGSQLQVWRASVLTVEQALDAGDADPKKVQAAAAQFVDAHLGEWVSAHGTETDSPQLRDALLKHIASQPQLTTELAKAAATTLYGGTVSDAELQALSREVKTASEEPNRTGADLAGLVLARVSASRDAQAHGYVPLAVPQLTPTDPATGTTQPPELSPPGKNASDAEKYDYYQQVIERVGGKFRSGPNQHNMLAFRTDTNAYKNGGAGAYDDTTVLLWKDSKGRKHVEQFASNTEPNRDSVEYSADVTHDGVADQGRLAPGYYEYRRQESKKFGSILRMTKDAPVQRDLNHDGRFTGKELKPMGGGAASMLMHRGGEDATWSAGCQTMAPADMARFIKAIGKDRSRIGYTLVQGDPDMRPVAFDRNSVGPGNSGDGADGGGGTSSTVGPSGGTPGGRTPGGGGAPSGTQTIDRPVPPPQASYGFDAALGVSQDFWISSILQMFGANISWSSVSWDSDFAGWIHSQPGFEGWKKGDKVPPSVLKDFLAFKVSKAATAKGGGKQAVSDAVDATVKGFTRSQTTASLEGQRTVRG
ncbi:MAG: hypothetical protein IPJ65_16585 [Archangiaceae bacterium]|nr:hypothetical protein [Archangiaceae bacterium]